MKNFNSMKIAGVALIVFALSLGFTGCKHSETSKANANDTTVVSDSDSILSDSVATDSAVAK
jgi:hypothetical protein